MATAKKLPSGNWRVRVHIGDGKYKSFTADTKKQAEYAAAEYLLYKKEGKKISIHAPRVGSDASPSLAYKLPCEFQSTLPAWGATTTEKTVQ